MDLTFFGLSKQELKELRNGSNNKQISLENSSTNNSDFNFDIDEQEVFYDLIDKNIKGEDVGYKFSVMPKKDLNKAARIKSKKWKQQTSLPWCEWAIFRTDFVPVFPGSTTPKTITIYYQTRGLIWGGSGTIPQPFQLNGNIWDMWIDGPKYTRFGIDNNYDGDTFYNWGVLWVSVDEPDEVSDNFY